MPDKLDPSISETAFGDIIQRCAVENGWLHCHVRPLKVRTRGNKWITPTSQKGYPDWHLVHPLLGEAVILEIKKRGGKVTREQKRWLHALSKVPGNRVFAAWPEDWPAIRRMLERGGAAVDAAVESSANRL
jgi:hypothetical protein